MKSTNPRDVAYLFRDYARQIHAKCSHKDPNLIRISISCGHVSNLSHRTKELHLNGTTPDRNVVRTQLPFLHLRSVPTRSRPTRRSKRSSLGRDRSRRGTRQRAARASETRKSFGRQAQRDREAKSEDDKERDSSGFDLFHGPFDVRRYGLGFGNLVVRDQQARPGLMMRGGTKYPLLSLYPHRYTCLPCNGQVPVPIALLSPHFSCARTIFFSPCSVDCVSKF